MRHWLTFFPCFDAFHFTHSQLLKLHGMCSGCPGPCRTFSCSPARVPSISPVPPVEPGALGCCSLGCQWVTTGSFATAVTPSSPPMQRRDCSKGPKRIWGDHGYLGMLPPCLHLLSWSTAWQRQITMDWLQTLMRLWKLISAIQIKRWQSDLLSSARELPSLVNKQKKKAAVKKTAAPCSNSDPYALRPGASLG